MFKPNYSFAKRQRELAKQKKKEEKRQRKAGKGDNLNDPGSTTVPAQSGSADPASSANEAP